MTDMVTLEPHQVAHAVALLYPQNHVVNFCALKNDRQLNGLLPGTLTDVPNVDYSILCP